MSWTSKQLQQHIEAAGKLNKIKNETFSHIRSLRSCKEGEILNFVLNLFKQEGLVTDRPLIVAFGASACKPHYSPKGKGRNLEKGMLVKLDIWGRLRQSKAPYADITWMAVRSKASQREARAFRTVILARNKALQLLREQLKKGVLPTGCDLDSVARKYISSQGFAKNFIHKLGHELGLTSPHGRGGRLCSANKQPLKRMVGYTIEPGIYVKNRFGVRSEIDFIVMGNSVLVTSPMQRKLVKV